MKVKKYLKPENDADHEEDHTSHYAQAPKEPRRAKRHVCQNCPDDVFRVHNQNKHHPCKIPLEDQSPYCFTFKRRLDKCHLTDGYLSVG